MLLITQLRLLSDQSLNHIILYISGLTLVKQSSLCIRIRTNSNGPGEQEPCYKYLNTHLLKSGPANLQVQFAHFLHILHISKNLRTYPKQNRNSLILHNIITPLTKLTFSISTLKSKSSGIPELWTKLQPNHNSTSARLQRTTQFRILVVLRGNDTSLEMNKQQLTLHIIYDTYAKFTFFNLMMYLFWLLHFLKYSLCIVHNKLYMFFNFINTHKLKASIENRTAFKLSHAKLNFKTNKSKESHTSLSSIVINRICTFPVLTGTAKDAQTKVDNIFFSRPHITNINYSKTKTFINLKTSYLHFFLQSKIKTKIVMVSTILTSEDQTIDQKMKTILTLVLSLSIQFTTCIIFLR